jgi:hypothetical protein
VVSATDPHGRILGFLDPEKNNIMFHQSIFSVALVRVSEAIDMFPSMTEYTVKVCTTEYLRVLLKSVLFPIAT